MTYTETLDWMFERLPMFQRQGAAAYKKDLSNITLLTSELGQPQLLFKSIHVGGTNGKGSTSHMLASILQEAGYKVGLYTSPHLKDFRERIRINGKVISEKYVVDFIAKNADFISKNALSFFELTVGMAFSAFAEEHVDVAVIEVGLGGRLDATNIITPEVSVITNIGLDHTAFLGDTLKEIAFEKAGIIKPKVPVVIGEKHPETATVFVKQAVLNGCQVFFASERDFKHFESDLTGEYQKHNQKFVLQTIEVLQASGRFLISDTHISNGLQKVVQNTGLQGRWQILNLKPKIICDTGHNAEGLQQVINQLKKQDFKRLHIVLGVVADKDLDSVLPLFPKNAIYYFCKPNMPRGLDVDILAEKALAFGLTGKKSQSVSLALDSAKEVANEEDVIFVGGSNFVVAEII
ncbi:bifunctional folylpolyglutamate synthase/dihydrofolate synthase [Leeuwenhoekiella sp. A16]|uniref:bifunctional folylpolyglutamate synthase/dihydrofolate synthase n=1 Tax=unclassified Leeuwenhoekiella TaxID=2615029 RepID=UPI003A80D4D0